MSDNRDERITFRVDPHTAEALDRFIGGSKRKKSDVVHEALHRFLLENEPGYRAEILGAPVVEPAIYPTLPSSVTAPVRLNEPDPKARAVGETVAKAALDAIVRNAGAVKAEQLRRQIEAQGTEPEDHPHPETSNGDPVEK